MSSTTSCVRMLNTLLSETQIVTASRVVKVLLCVICCEVQVKLHETV